MRHLVTAFAIALGGSSAWAQPGAVDGALHDVRELGAKCDGTTDDEAAFEAAAVAVARSPRSRREGPSTLERWSSST